ncbi:uncharacterized protein LOC111903523 isoform X1 [Lactuca sativa]|uniref:uncharacterized protein LOC111903523 isoform X1 n=1 Tax=Lactuca sativa TaxID=4236 RepID=UPI000CD83A1B|nr:uncharacterized protein LOC111903523 isoform X1 [Lactuca sativa]
MISAISWVPKGASKAVPSAADPPSKEEIEEIKKTVLVEQGYGLGGVDVESEEDDEDMSVDASKQPAEIEQALGAANALGKASTRKAGGSDLRDIADGLDELNMDDYDDEDDAIDIFGSGLGDTFYPSNELDPYIKDKDDDEDSEELEDVIIKADDAVVVCARNEDDMSHLEVWIVEDPEGDSNMYVHHDILIPAFPLCTAWLDCPIKGGEKGNFIAVGSMEPAIEIWDLDIMDEVQPSLILGGVAEKKKKKKKGKKTEKSIKYKEDSHTDAVLGLSWNKGYRNILASASADKLVKIWDVATGKCKLTMDHHTDKVQAVAWNHHEHEVLLSGSFDHTVVMRDGRVPTHLGFKWSVSADVESLAWDPHEQHSFVVSLEDGTVVGFDIRTATSNPSAELKPNFTLHAHDKAVCAISYNPIAPNLLATGSQDKMVKLWDLSNNQPSCIASQNRKAGAIFSLSFSQDCPFLLALGGSKGNLELWDTLSDVAISRRFGKYAVQNKVPASA